MGFFEYVAFNKVDIVLMFIGFIGFIATLIILSVFLDNEGSFDVKITKPFVPALIIFCLAFFIGLLLPGESYFKEMSRRENQGKVDEHYLNAKIDDIQRDIDIIKDKLKIEEE